jgi:hypothetical protein
MNDLKMAINVFEILKYCQKFSREAVTRSKIWHLPKFKVIATNYVGGLKRTVFTYDAFKAGKNQANI